MSLYLETFQSRLFFLLYATFLRAVTHDNDEHVISFPHIQISHSKCVNLTHSDCLSGDVFVLKNCMERKISF